MRGRRRDRRRRHRRCRGDGRPARPQRGRRAGPSATSGGAWASRIRRGRSCGAPAAGRRASRRRASAARAAHPGAARHRRREPHQAIDAAEVGVGRGAQQRLELGLLQEADVGVGRADARLVDELARVRRRPAAPLAELEDRVQRPEVVEDALRRAAVAALRRDECLDVARLDAVQRLGVEERGEVDAQVRLVVHQGRALAADPRAVVEVATAGVHDRGPLVWCRGRACGG